MSSLKQFRTILRYLKPFWRQQAVIYVLTLVTVALGLISPYLTKLVIDTAFPQRNMRLFLVLLLLGGALFIANGIVNGYMQYLNQSIRLRLTLRLSKNLFKKLQRVPYQYFQDASSGAHVYRLTYDIEQVVASFSSVVSDSVLLVVRFICIAVIIVLLDWRFAVVMAVVAPVLYCIPLYFTRKLKKIKEELIEHLQEAFQASFEILSHMQLVKMLGKERQAIFSYMQRLVRYIRLNVRYNKVELMSSYGNSFTGRLAMGVVVLCGGFWIMRGQLTLGTFTALMIYLAQVSGIFDGIMQLFQRVSFGMISWGRLQHVFEIRNSPMEDASAQPIRFSSGLIEFRAVSFGYLSHVKVISNFSASIPGGSCVAIAGPSGCGKTTLINLLMRLYRPETGGIYIDGYEHARITADALYGQIGVVLQEPFLWNDTITYNITYGKPAATAEEVRQAARVACADEFIGALENGFLTVIGENACKISEGQKQRISIARAIINHPKILICDEAFSSVDAQLEGAILENIRNFLPSSTIIVISHRLSTIMRADEVYFLVGGGDVIRGTHQELLGASQQYRKYLALNGNESG